MTEADQTVTYWIDRLKADDSQAAAAIWDRYFHKLVQLARKKLGNIPNRVVDAEDVAISVFKSLCLGAAKGNFSQLTDRSDLWRLLVTITHQKTVDYIRHANAEKRGGGEVRGDSIFKQSLEGGELAGFDGCEGDGPGPEFLIILQDQFQHLLGLLRNDELREIALGRLEGKNNAEIAEELQVSRRSIDRKMRLIREEWEGELLEEFQEKSSEADSPDTPDEDDE